MYILLVQFIFIHLSFATTISSSNNINFDQLNEILSQSGWKSVKEFRVIHCDDTTKENQTFMVEDLIRLDDHEKIVTEINGQQKLEQCSILLSSIYLIILKSIYYKYNIMLDVYKNSDIHDTDKNEAFQHFYILVHYLNPLINCMIEALEFFNKPNAVLKTLKKLKKWHEDIYKYSIEVNYTNFNTKETTEFYEKLLSLRIFNNLSKFKIHYNFEGNEPKIIKMFKRSISYKFPHNILNKVSNGEVDQDGVQKFCHDFGFKNNSNLSNPNNIKFNQLNEILSQSGWKSVEEFSVTHCDDTTKDNQTFTIKDLIRVDEHENIIVTEINGQEKLEQCSILLSSIYCIILEPLKYVRSRLSIDIWSMTTHDIHINTNFRHFYILVHYLNPLINCMIEALEFLNKPNDVLVALKKLKIWHNKIYEYTIKEKCDYFIIEETERFYRKLPSLQFFYNFSEFNIHYKFEGKEPEVLKMFTESILNDFPHNILEKVSNGEVDQDGVKKFCHDFGFKNKSVSQKMARKY